MDRYSVGYTKGDFSYLEYANGERFRFKLTPNKSAHDLEKTSNAYTITEDELGWIRKVLEGNKPSPNEVNISPSYIYQKKVESERYRNRGIIRKELDVLRSNLRNFTPEELIELKSPTKREQQRIQNFPGIYIIYNSVKNMYYVGQSVKVFDRSYTHFVEDKSKNKPRYRYTAQFNMPEIYDDYHSGNKFNVSLIPLGKTSFSTLNELEANAIVAYNSEYPNGYNRVKGNTLDKPIFKNDDLKQVAELLLDKVKGTEMFSRLKNNVDRRNYTGRLFSELELPKNIGFLVDFVDMIRAYQKANKKR